LRGSSQDSVSFPRESHLQTFRALR
jgi:hypothetical protein